LKPRPDYPRSGRNKPCRLAGPTYSKAGWASVPFPDGPPSSTAPAGRIPARLAGSLTRLGRFRLSPAGPLAFLPRLGLSRICPGMGRRHSFPGWAAMPRPSSVPWAGQLVPSLPDWATRPTAPPGPRGSPLPGRHPLALVCPGWAETPASGWAAIHPGRYSQPRPGFFMPAGLASAHYSGWARPGFPGPGRITLPKAEIYLLRGFLLIWHRLHRIVPVLGCL
jgi:hypothetical protein